MNYQKVLQILDNFDYRDFDYIKGCGKALPLIMPCKTFPAKFTYKSEKEFDKPIESPTKKGINSEKQVCALLNLFDFDYVYPTKSFSVLDVDYMTDIAVRKNNLWLTFQVKSSEKEVKKVNFTGDMKPIHILYEHKSRNILFNELQYLLSLLDIGLKVDIEGIKKEYVPLIRKLRSVSQADLNKFEIIKPGFAKALHILFSINVLKADSEHYYLT